MPKKNRDIFVGHPVLVCWCGCYVCNISSWDRNCIDRKTWQNNLEHFTVITDSILTNKTNRRFADCIIYKNKNTLIASTRRRIINGTIMNNFINRFNGRYVKRLMNRFNKRIMRRNYEQIYRTEHWENQKQVYKKTDMFM